MSLRVCRCVLPLSSPRRTSTPKAATRTHSFLATTTSNIISTYGASSSLFVAGPAAPPAGPTEHLERPAMERVEAHRERLAPLLAMTGLVKRFTGTLALDHVDFDVKGGEVHALLGQNGAGKSTLIKIMAGVYEADEGEFLLAGRPLRPAAGSLPIAFIHQDLGLVEWMTVAENVALQTGYPRSWIAGLKG